MNPLLLLTIYCVLILLASIAGGLLPHIVKLTHRRMEFAVSFVAGVMLGVGLLHLLGHAIESVQAAEGVGSVQGVMQWVLIGILAMFFFERFFCYHHHDPPTVDDDEPAHSHGQCQHEEHHGHDVTWSGAAFGLTLHSIVAGVALAAAVAHEAKEVQLAGLSTFLVILLHKPFDSLTIATLMSKGGWPKQTKHLINGLFALAIPFGAAAFHIGVLRHVGTESAVLPYALAFSAGTFMCIAMSDILPELQFHHHDRWKLSIALLSGLAVAWMVSMIEVGHVH